MLLTILKQPCACQVVVGHVKTHGGPDLAHRH